MAVAQTLNDPKGDHSKRDNLSLEAILGAMATVIYIDGVWFSLYLFLCTLLQVISHMGINMSFPSSTH